MTENEDKTREILTLTSRTNNGNFFESENAKYLLRNCDRKFEGVKNKPQYYISRKTGNELKFLSGLFPTRIENQYSWDEKNAQGMKKFMIAEFVHNGDQLILQSR